MRRFIAVILALVALAAVGCGGSSPKDQADRAIEQNAKDFVPYVPHNGVEGDNYNFAQRTYDDPATILWCTIFPQSNTAPIVTIPIAGKLTSSTTSPRAPERVYNGDGDSNPVVPNTSVDGLYHPNPPPYRYGRTPGGQLVDLTDLPTLCTTKPLAFQRESVHVQVDGGLNAATQAASAALRSGDRAKAQATLEQAAGQ